MVINIETPSHLFSFFLSGILKQNKANQLWQEYVDGD